MGVPKLSLAFVLRKPERNLPSLRRSDASHITVITNERDFLPT